MPKIRCLCENIISVGEIPSPHQFMIISDSEFENLASFSSKFDQINLTDFYQRMDIVVKCNICGRLHIFWDGFDKPQSIYKLEQ